MRQTVNVFNHQNLFLFQKNVKRSWFNGRMHASHACDPGPIPGGRNFFVFLFFLSSKQTFFFPSFSTLTVSLMSKHPQKASDQSEAGPSLEDHMLSLKQLKEELDREEAEGGQMQLRSGTVVTPRKPKPRAKVKSEKPEVKTEDTAAEAPKEEETVYMGLRNRRVVMTPKSSSARVRRRSARTKETLSEEETQASVVEAEHAIQCILAERAAEEAAQEPPQTPEKLKKKTKKDAKRASPQPQPKQKRHASETHKPQSHPVVRCAVGTVLVLCAVLALAAGALGFCAAKGVPVVLHNALDFDAVLPARQAAALRTFLRNAEALYGTLDPRTQVLGASVVFVVVAGLCGLCWAVLSLVRAAEEASKVDPVRALQKLLACRRKLLEHRAAVCASSSQVLFYLLLMWLFIVTGV